MTRSTNVWYTFVPETAFVLNPLLQEYSVEHKEINICENWKNWQYNNVPVLYNLPMENYSIGRTLVGR